MNSTSTVMVETQRNPGCLIQLLWFAFVGIWLGQAWMAIAWFFMLTIIGIPIGIVMLNNIPRIIALREPGQYVVVRGMDGGLQKRAFEPPQINFLLRALYFVLVGWWFSALWMELAYLLCLTIIGLPIGFWMFDVTPAVLSLKRS